jgi:SWI/SNF-related matrix-associated actin-dependent regulator 1 of chromatin subfamily A
MKSTRVITTKQGNLKIKLFFDYDKKVIEKVRTLSDRKWNKTGKFWTCPVTIDNIQLLDKWHFHLCHALKKQLKDLTSIQNNIKPINNIKGLKAVLYDYQAAGIGFIEAKNGRVLIADEMGLGKTLQSLGYMQLHPEINPVLIVCPATLKENWKNEILKFTSITSIQVLEGRKPETTPLLADVIIINYDIITAWKDKLIKHTFKLMVTDECHMFKNNTADRTKSIMKIGKAMPHVLALSGTPIVNRPIEIHNALKLINPVVAGNRMTFAKRYCGAKHTGFGWDFNGASNIKELHDKLTKSIMIRRLKKDVLKDLPDKQYSFVPIQLSNEKEYKDAKNNFVEYVLKGYEKGLINQNEEAEKQLKKFNKQNGIKTDAIQMGLSFEDIEYLKEEKREKITVAQQLVEIEVLKQVAVKGKLKKSFDWIENFLESGEKIVLFATHKFVIQAVMDHFPKISVKIDGSTPKNKRMGIVEDFQTNKKIKIFIGNYKAAGIGITLTAASHVGLLEYPWTPGELAQAIDRVHRIGQKNAVNVYYLYAQETIEKKLVKLLDNKVQVLNGVLDGEYSGINNIFPELLKDLVNI